ncbi:NTP transferase domain-containing protein [Sphingomonas sp. CFBP 8760]|uniref:NTP transferase domain-containing protein n=1 Tax=Sphingomonas sp. CFBP 8760 TaxID=2775282 RepID=UPI00177CEB1D|nr:NTP transferase domain-containing protein [Sphingomonas sp. CFBP 8760]MBD8547007.1 nucleotidyltransferase family protein [Sphingomonas sp. CFBP 8760]
MTAPFAALILAGSRAGVVDPVAAYAGVPHKAMILLQGTTLLARVAAALRGAGAGRIAVSADHPAVLIEAMRLGLEVIPPAAGPSDSVARGFDVLGAPLLVTTADHALLEPAWVARFIADAPAADVAALLARRPEVEAAAPGTRRTWLRFADGSWSGCNLFWLATPQAAAAIGLWREVEADRKRPWRIVRRLGPGLLFRYLTGRLTLATAIRHLGRRAGIEAAVVATPFGLAAVDVDKPADLDLVRQLVDRPGPSSPHSC